MRQDETIDPRLQAIRDRLNTSSAAQVILDLARVITETEDPTLSYKEFEDQLPSYIADEIGGLPAAQRYPDVKRSLNIFPEREQEYLELLYLAQLEDEDKLPRPENIPPVDLSFLPKPTHTLAELVDTLAQEIIAKIKPELMDSLQDIRDGFFTLVNRQGGKLVPVLDDMHSQLGIGSDAPNDTLLYLAATQMATQDHFDVPAQEVWSMGRSGDLFKVALQAARKVGLDEDAANAFAKQYVISRMMH